MAVNVLALLAAVVFLLELLGVGPGGVDMTVLGLFLLALAVALALTWAPRRRG